jgi:hypothetical protein
MSASWRRILIQHERILREGAASQAASSAGWRIWIPEPETKKGRETPAFERLKPELLLGFCFLVVFLGGGSLLVVFLGVVVSVNSAGSEHGGNEGSDQFGHERDPRIDIENTQCDLAVPSCNALEIGPLTRERGV